MVIPDAPANAYGLTRRALTHPVLASGVLALVGLWGATAWTDSVPLLAIASAAFALMGWREFGPKGRVRRKLVEDPQADARGRAFLATHRISICIACAMVAAAIEVTLFIADGRSYSLARVVLVSLAAGVLVFGSTFAIIAFALRKRPSE